MRRPFTTVCLLCHARSSQPFIERVRREPRLRALLEHQKEFHILWEVDRKKHFPSGYVRFVHPEWGHERERVRANTLLTVGLVYRVLEEHAHGRYVELVEHAEMLFNSVHFVDAGE